MFKSKIDNSAQAWKSKYFNSLEELETKEKQWDGMEQVLRNAMSRMSVMLSGLDKKLDKELDYLRHALRRGADGSKIRELTDSMLATMEQVEARHEQFKPLTMAESYETLLEGITLPRGCNREIKALKKTVSKLTTEDRPNEVVKEFAELLLHSFRLIKEDVEKKTKHEPVKQKVEKNKQREPELPAESVDLAARSGLDELMSSLTLFGDLKRSVDLVHNKLSNVSIEKELSQLAVELANVLNQALPAEQVSSQADQSASDESDLTINEVLLQLLERIDLPDTLNNEVAAIQLQLEGDVDEQEWPGLLENISHLIRSMREAAIEEKKNLESFLEQLTGQLQTLDDFISGVELGHKNSMQQGEILSERMHDHITHIGKSMDGASELEQLKNMIRQRLGTIEEHMQEFHDHEHNRDLHAQEQIRGLNEKIKEMEIDAEELRSKVMNEREQAFLDPLTGIYNRMGYNERIEQEYARWKRYQSALSLIVVDIDLFKHVNDNYGHIAGDKVLQTVAKHLGASIRETDYLARYGGEEFVIIMPDTSADEGLAVAEKLRSNIEECGFHYKGESVTVTISCGIAEFETGNEINDVFEKADVAMYQAKNDGRNRCFYK